MVYGPDIATVEWPLSEIVDVDHHQRTNRQFRFVDFWGVLGQIRIRAPVAKAVARAVAV